MADVEETEAEAEAEELAFDTLVHGLTTEEVDRALTETWYEADRDGSGYLDRKEIMKFLKDLPLNLTRKERNIIMAEVDFDENGHITRQQFLPLAHAVLLEVVKQEFFHVDFQGTTLEEYLLGILQEKDTEGTGFLKASKVRSALRDADFGLTKFSLYTIVAEAPMSGNRIVIEQFVPIAARMIQTMAAPSAQDAALRRQALAMMDDEAPTVAGMAMGELEQRLREFFKSFDADGSGYLEMNEFEEAITTGTKGMGIEFTPAEAQLLLVAADDDDDGRISYEEFMRVAIDLLEYHDREARVMEFHRSQLEGDEEEA
jgi:Ca2+-binding EF-hand superfamily protein